MVQILKFLLMISNCNNDGSDFEFVDDDDIVIVITVDQILNLLMMMIK